MQFYAIPIFEIFKKFRLSLMIRGTPLAQSKLPATIWRPGACIQSGLLGLGSAHGAGIGTGAAIDAGIGIDDVLAVTLGDRFNGAVLCAKTAGDALITDLVSHSNIPPWDVVFWVRSIIAYFFGFENTFLKNFLIFFAGSARIFWVFAESRVPARKRAPVRGAGPTDQDPL